MGGVWGTAPAGCGAEPRGENLAQNARFQANFGWGKGPTSPEWPQAKDWSTVRRCESAPALRCLWASPVACCWCCCWCCCRCCGHARASHAACVLSARTTRLQPLARAFLLQSTTVAERLRRLVGRRRGAASASALLCAAQRRLTLMGPCLRRRLHTSFPCPF
jgi:hypothetical protein